MEYGKIIAITGLPGLFELLTSKNDGAIVRSLEDKATRFVSSRVHNFSHLESIEVFTVRDNVNLIEVFHAMEKEGGKIPDGKDGAALRKYFEKVYPDLDFERVYASDLKKMVKWFEVLKENKIEIKLSERPAEDEPENEEDGAGEESPKAGANKTRATGDKTDGGADKSADKSKSGADKPKGGDKPASASDKAASADKQDKKATPKDKSADKADAASESKPKKAAEKKTTAPTDKESASKPAKKSATGSKSADKSDDPQKPAKKSAPKKKG